MAAAAPVPLEEPAPLLGYEADSTRPSCPVWSMARSTRETAQKTSVTKSTAKDALGRESPGPVYAPKRQMSLPSYSFGTAKRPSPGKTCRDTTSDLIAKVDKAPKVLVTRPRPRSATMGTAPRDAPLNAPDLCTFVAGAVSPGPNRYRPTSAPSRTPPSFSIRMRPDMTNLGPSAKVGPGSYKAPGPEFTKRIGPSWTFSGGERWQKAGRFQDSGRLWDGTGARRLQFKPKQSAPPEWSLPKSTREGRTRTAFVPVPGDAASEGARLRLSCPELPNRVGPGGRLPPNPVQISPYRRE